MKKEERIPIDTEADLKANAVAILRRVNEDERKGLLFLLNPVFALEEAGFDLSPAMRQHLRHGLRYGARAKARIRSLETEVAEMVGHPVQASSAGQVARLLFDELKLPIPVQAAAPSQGPKPTQSKPGTHEADIEPSVKASAAAAEPKPRITQEILEALRDQHPVVPKIIELRALLRSGWHFVDRQTYEKVKDGASVTLLRGVRFRRSRSGPG